VLTPGFAQATIDSERLEVSWPARHLCQSLAGELEFSLSLYGLQNSVSFAEGGTRVAPLLELLAKDLSAAIYARFHSSDRDSQHAGCFAYRKLVEVAILERDTYCGP